MKLEPLVILQLVIDNDAFLNYKTKCMNDNEKADK